MSEGRDFVRRLVQSQTFVSQSVSVGAFVMERRPSIPPSSVALSQSRRPNAEDARSIVMWIVDELQREYGDRVVCQWAELMNSSYGGQMTPETVGRLQKIMKAHEGLRTDQSQPWTFVISESLLGNVHDFLKALQFAEASPLEQFSAQSIRFHLDTEGQAQIAFFPSSFVDFRDEELDRRSYTVRDTLRRELVPKPAAAFASYLRLLPLFPRTYVPDPGPTSSQTVSWRKVATQRVGRHVLNRLVQDLLEALPFNVPTPTGPTADEDGRMFIDQRAVIVVEEWTWRKDEEWMQDAMVDLLLGRCTVQDL